MDVRFFLGKKLGMLFLAGLWGSLVCGVQGGTAPPASAFPWWAVGSEDFLVLAESASKPSPAGQAWAEDIPSPGRPDALPKPTSPSSTEQPDSKSPSASVPAKNPSAAATGQQASPQAGPAIEPPVPEAPEPPETTQSVQKLFDLFLEKPTGENYLKVLDALCRHPAYDPYSADLDEVAQLLEKRRYEEAKATLDKAMPNLLLSPRAHNYYRVIAEAMGDGQEAQRRDQIAQKCLQGIQATGRGLVEAASGEPKPDQLPTRPFQVARVSDQYDLVRSLGKRPRVHSQSLRRIEDRWYDVLRCSDETGRVFHVWFDVTRPLAALSRQIQKPKPPPGPPSSKEQEP